MIIADLCYANCNIRLISISPAFCCFQCYVCHMAYLATFPISRSVIVTKSAIAQFITRLSWPAYLPCCWPSGTCVTYLTLGDVRAHCSNWLVTSHSPTRRYTGDIDWLESDIRPLNLAATIQLLLKTPITRDSFWCAVGRHWRTFNIGRSCRFAKAPSSQTSIQGLRLSSESAESYETLALCPRCQTNFSSSFSPPSSASSSSSLDSLYCRRSTLRCCYLRCCL